jgi:hypothetical protein
MSRLFGPDFITQKYLRQYPDSERARSWAGVMVHIQTENGVWRTGGSGYTYTGKPDAWILPFEEAIKKIDHCGPEKMGSFLRAEPLKVKEAHPLARFGSPDIAPLGLYRVHWKSGGSSLAAIGMMENGDRWIAPTNWIKPWAMPTAGGWADIDHLEPIDPPAPVLIGGGE